LKSRVPHSYAGIERDEIDSRVDAHRAKLMENLNKMQQDVKKIQQHQVHELAVAKGFLI
jgi:hypothetical protein